MMLTRKWRLGPSAVGTAAIRLLAATVAGLWLAAGAALAQSAQPAPVPGEVSVSTASGYARLIFRFQHEVPTQVQVNGSILIVSFKQPVDVDVDHLNVGAPDYISAARRDPDGMAIRIALAQPVTPHLMPADEQVFLDLLPASWTGVPPGLPQKVVDELARRLREAEKKARLHQQLKQWKKEKPIRVQVAKQPTFTRYVFPLTSSIAVAADRGHNGLTLVFDAPLRFDLAEPLADLPSFVGSIESKLDQDAASVRFLFNGKVDVRTFRDDDNYVVDVSATKIAHPVVDQLDQRLQQLQQSETAAAKSAPPAGNPPQTVSAGANRSIGEASPAASKQPAPRQRAPEQQAPEQQASTPPAAAPPAPSAVVQKNAHTVRPPSAAKSSAAAPPKPPHPAALAAAAPAERSNAQSAGARPEQPPAAVAAKPPAAADHDQPAAAPAPVAPAPVAPTPAVKAPAFAPKSAKPREPEAKSERPVKTSERKLKVEVRDEANSVRMLFPFLSTTPAAVFVRNGVLWLVFDTDTKVDIDPIRDDQSGIIRSVSVSHNDGLVLRLRLDRPRLSSVAAAGSGWAVTIGDEVVSPSAPIMVRRSMVGPSHASLVIPFEGAGRLHRLTDPEAEDTLLVVTASAPVRGILDPHHFVQLDALASSQGIVIRPLADDIVIQLEPDRVVIGRPDGLTLSPQSVARRHAGVATGSVFDMTEWKRDRKGNFFHEESRLFSEAADAPTKEKFAIHVRIGRFFIARGMYPEAAGALGLALSAQHAKDETPVTYVLLGIAHIMSFRPAAGLKDLAQPNIGDRHDAPLWRAVAHAEQHKWVRAHDGFRRSQMSIGTLPIELQRFVLLRSARSALEVGDYESAANQLNDFETIGTTPLLQPAIDVLRGRVAEKLGRTGDALADFRVAMKSDNRQAATQARLQTVVVRVHAGDIKPKVAIAELETISVIWRGDDTEIKALQLLARLYTKQGRLRDALDVMRQAMKSDSNSNLAQSIQDEAASTFESLFLSPKAKALPAIDALSLFYQFRDLTPMGRRGDEMIRRLAERLVSVDLLDQAAELLQHQVDHRLHGAARAQVAARLATIYLMNHKPERALKVLRSTHFSGLATTLRNRRLLLEARALSELNRPDIALEIIADIPGGTAQRLRADVLWRAHRWRQAAVQFERLLGNRWRSWKPLDATERVQVLRAAIGYALASDSLDLGRLRSRYSAKMLGGPDSHAFQVVSAPIGVGSAEFRSVASSVGSTDTLDDFLKDLRDSFPATSVQAPQPSPQQGAGDASSAPGAKQPSAAKSKPPATAPTVGTGPAS